MTKRHFIALADWIRCANDGKHHPDIFYERPLIEDIADWLMTQNPRFNRERWLSYVKEDTK